ncbi:hypothetical protein N7478_001486 [Penicillium angulare]|uniref:uncharacterized protein n=1 Tax=Penicillium angulare TaxID=116970 RepID=UPI002541B445|nr:uncharacterized protein N7478_001486 [Penicillium angulare]KAJ5292235.1 hypothetical protein N7478_001486 [Penicillium angulare]
MIPGLTLCFQGSMCGVLGTRTLVSHAGFWPGVSERSKDWVLQNLRIRGSLIFTEALFHSLLVDKVSPLFGAVTAQRLDIAARFIKEYHVNIDFEYAGKNMLLLLLAIDLQYPEAVGLILKYQPNLRSSCDLGGRGPLSLAVVGGDAPIVERFFNVKRLMSRIISAGRRLQHANPERHHIAVEMLVTHTGIDVNCQSSQHDPHLALAVKKLQGQQSTAEDERLYGTLSTEATTTS